MPKRATASYESLFRTMRRNFTKTMTFENEADRVVASKLGRRTIDDSQLTANLTVLVNMLSAWWPLVGWQLITARNREQLRDALVPLKDHPNRHLIDRLIRPSELIVEAGDIRKKRDIYRRAVEQRRSTQTEYERCTNNCHELQVAISGAKNEQIDPLLRAFVRHGMAYHIACSKASIAEEEETEIERELLAMESGFAQEQLVLFITKQKYTLDPWNIAKATAGLPYAINIPFLGAPQSHARCAALSCSSWPNYSYQVFETIQSCWERSQHSTLSLVDFFESEIRSLPKVVMQTHPIMGRHKCENYVRAHLCKNWWDLTRALELSLSAKGDPRPMHFVIAANFDICIGQPKTAADIALAKAARICD